MVTWNPGTRRYWRKWLHGTRVPGDTEEWLHGTRVHGEIEKWLHGTRYPDILKNGYMEPGVPGDTGEWLHGIRVPGGSIILFLTNYNLTLKHTLDFFGNLVLDL